MTRLSISYNIDTVKFDRRTGLGHDEPAPTLRMRRFMIVRPRPTEGPPKASQSRAASRGRASAVPSRRFAQRAGAGRAEEPRALWARRAQPARHRRRPRRLARGAGASFGTLTGLRTALAAVGYAQFRTAMQQARAAAGPDPEAQMRAVGVSYIAFAESRPALFRLMFRVTLLDWTDEALQTAATEARAELIEICRPAADQLGTHNSADARGARATRLVLRAWLCPSQRQRSVRPRLPGRGWRARYFRIAVRRPFEADAKPA